MQTIEAVAAGTSPPTNDEAPVVVAARGFRDQAEQNCVDSAAITATAEADKAFANMRALLAMHGFELHILSNEEGGDEYLVRRWSQCRTLPDMSAVRAFAARVGVCA